MAGGISDVLNLRGSVEASGRAFDETPSQLSYCLVIGVDVISRTVTIKHISSSLEESGVPYLSPSASSLRGEDFIPVIGDVGVVGITSNGSKLIIGFMGGANRSGELVLKQGDMLWKSLGDSIIKQDADGNIFLMTVSGAHVLLTKEGSLKIMSKDLRLETDLSEKFEGRVGDFFTAYEKYYRYKDELMDNSVEGILSVLSGEYEMETWGKFPVVEIHRGARLNGLGEAEAIEDIPLVYSLEVNDDQDGTNLAHLKIDEAGNVFLSGTTITIPGFEPGGGGGGSASSVNVYSAEPGTVLGKASTPARYSKLILPILPVDQLPPYTSGGDVMVFNYRVGVLYPSVIPGPDIPSMVQDLTISLTAYTEGTGLEMVAVYSVTKFMGGLLAHSVSSLTAITDETDMVYLLVTFDAGVAEVPLTFKLREVDVAFGTGSNDVIAIDQEWPIDISHSDTAGVPSGYTWLEGVMGMTAEVPYAPDPAPSYRQKGSSTFNTTSGRTINLATAVANAADYSVYVTPTSNPAGYLGEIWVIKTTTNFTVYCSGSTTTTTFDYIVF